MRSLFVSAWLLPETARAVDTLVVVCGPTSKDTRDSRFSLWLQKTAVAHDEMASVCVAAFILAEAGLLHKQASNNSLGLCCRFAEEISRCQSRCESDLDTRWEYLYLCRNQAGIDLALAMVEEDHGASVALDVARNLSCFCADLAVRRNSAFPYQRKLGT